jgi:cobyrinic acid a,c-diamide synthase
MARSVAAIVHGYASFDADVRVAGVVLNRVGSDAHAALLREALEPLGVPVLGALRRDDDVTAPERHLGLVPVGERVERARAALDRLGALVGGGCDLEGLLALARSAPDLPGEAWSPERWPRRAGAPESRHADAGDAPAGPVRSELSCNLMCLVRQILVRQMLVHQICDTCRTPRLDRARRRRFNAPWWSWQARLSFT